MIVVISAAAITAVPIIESSPVPGVMMSLAPAVTVMVSLPEPALI
jgi:hypothetical protein